MDNITYLTSSTKSQCVIKLDSFQLNYYEQSSIEIHSPNGDHLATIGYDTQKEARKNELLQLQEQIELLQSLCEKVTREIELPAPAVAGLANLLFRIRKFMPKE